MIFKDNYQKKIYILNKIKKLEIEINDKMIFIERTEANIKDLQKELVIINKKIENEGNDSGWLTEVSR